MAATDIDMADSDHDNTARTPAVVYDEKERRYVHTASGYTWTKDEDAPGFAWKNKRAQEESNRAWEQIVDKEAMIGTRFGDIGLEEETSKQ